TAKPEPLKAEPESVANPAAGLAATVLDIASCVDGLRSERQTLAKRVAATPLAIELSTQRYKLVGSVCAALAVAGAMLAYGSWALRSHTSTWLGVIAFVLGILVLAGASYQFTLSPRERLRSLEERLRKEASFRRVAVLGELIPICRDWSHQD